MPTSGQQGFMILTKMLTGNHKYAATATDKGLGSYYVNDLPIAAIKEPVEFVGSEGITASIGPWMARVAEALSDQWVMGQPISKLRKILIDASDDRMEQHMIFFSVVFNDSAEIMVGGCTDFSGEGGVGTHTVDLFIAFLENLFGVAVTEEHYQGIYEKVSTILIDAENKQWEESHGEEE